MTEEVLFLASPGSPLISGVKYTIRTEFMYKWFKNSEAEDIVKDGKTLKEYGICGKMPKFVKTNCDHAFLICHCSPFNYGKREKYIGICSVCNKKFDFPEDVVEHLKKKYSQKRVVVDSKKSGCAIF